MIDMNKACFIIPYFGKLPNYFQLFLKSCRLNPDFNWLIFTDDNTNYDYPPNVKRIILSFYELRKLIAEKFDFEIALSRPYKLCDLKPAYGYIFYDYIAEYHFWGHCDLDTIMGDLSHFLTDSLLTDYDKIFCLGHLSLFRNSEEINTLFMSDVKGRKLYKEVFQCELNQWFDEPWKDEFNINQIFVNKGKRIYEKDLSLNPSRGYGKFRRTVFQGMDNTSINRGYKVEEYKDALYLWENGNICRYFMDNGVLIREDYPYIHLQARKMRVSLEAVTADVYKIVPDEFLPIEEYPITTDSFCKIKRTGRCRHIQRLYWKKIVNKCNKILHLK